MLVWMFANVAIGLEETVGLAVAVGEGGSGVGVRVGVTVSVGFGDGGCVAVVVGVGITFSGGQPEGKLLMFEIMSVSSPAEIIPFPLRSAFVHCLSGPGIAAQPVAIPPHKLMMLITLV